MCIRDSPQTDDLRYWSNVQPLLRKRRLRIDSAEMWVQLTPAPDSLSVALCDSAQSATAVTQHHREHVRTEPGRICATVDGVDVAYHYFYQNTGVQGCPTLYLHTALGQVELVDLTYQPVRRDDLQRNGEVLATTEGKVVAVAIEVGSAVSAGELLVVVEAMKMEHRHLAPVDGVVEQLTARVDEQVKKGEMLVAVAANSDEAGSTNRQ